MARETDQQCDLHDWTSLRSELLFIFDAPIPASVSGIKAMREGEISAWYVRKGWARLTSSDGTTTARSGQWLLWSSHAATQSFSSDCHLLSLRVLLDWPSGDSLFETAGVLTLESQAYPRLLRIAEQLLSQVGFRSWVEHAGQDCRHEFWGRARMNLHDYIRYANRLMNWLGLLADAMADKQIGIRTPSYVDPRILRAAQLLDTLPPTARFPTQRMQKICGLSLGRINRLFVEAYNETAHSYWETRRFSRARLALERPQVRVKEVAAELGFVQLSHFSAWFKRRAGISPREYLRRMAAQEGT